MEAGGTPSWLLSIMMLAAFALFWGATKLLRNPEDRRRGWLMMTAGVVLIGNVLIWVWP